MLTLALPVLLVHKLGDDDVVTTIGEPADTQIELVPVHPLASVTFTM
jgi:hypothetical protein